MMDNSTNCKLVCAVCVYSLIVHVTMGTCDEYEL